MVQASALGKRTADAGSIVHRAIRRRGALSNSNGTSTEQAALAPSLAARTGGAGPCAAQPALTAASCWPSTSAPSQAGQQAPDAPATAAGSSILLSMSAPPRGLGGSGGMPLFMPPFAPFATSSAGMPGAGSGAMLLLVPGCTLGTPAPSAPITVGPPSSTTDGRGLAQQAQSTFVVADGSSVSLSLALGVPTFPGMALAAAKCLGMPFGMMMGAMPPPFFMFMMQRQMAIMQQAACAAGGMAGMMSPFVFSVPHMAGASGLPCCPPSMLGPVGGAWASLGADQVSGAKPLLGSGGLLADATQQHQHQPLLPNLDMAAVVSALTEAQQRHHALGVSGDDTTTTVTTRSSAGNCCHAAHQTGSDGAELMLLRSDTHGSHPSSRPSSSTDTLTGGHGAAPHQGGLLFGGADCSVDEDEVQLTDLEFNSFIDSFLFSSALAGGGGALDTVVAGGGGAGGGALAGVVMLDAMAAVGDPALDLHLPLAELLPELAMEPPMSTAVASAQPPPPPPGVPAVRTPLGLALEPHSVLDRLGKLPAGVPAASPPGCGAAAMERDIGSADVIRLALA